MAQCPMRASSYIKRLKPDLDSWVEAGWVPQSSKEKIIAQAEAQKSGINFVGVLAITGAVLLGFAAISFVASNWAQMGKLLRMSLMLAGLWAAFGIAAFATWRNIMAYAHAFGLLGAVLFGAAIMLIAQSFNIQAHYPTGILIWFFGAISAAMVLRSNPILIFSSLLLGLWMIMAFEGAVPDTIQYWLYPLLALGVGYIAGKFKSMATINILSMATLLFVPAYLIAEFDYRPFTDGQLMHISAGIFIVLALAMASLRPHIFGAYVFIIWMVIAALLFGFLTQIALPTEQLPEAETFQKYKHLAVVLALITGLLLWLVLKKQIRPIFAGGVLLAIAVMVHTPVLLTFVGVLPVQILYGAIFFGICIALLMQGMLDHNRPIVWIGGTGFGAQALYVYFETFKDLLNTSLFFFVGGALLLGLSLLALRLNKQIEQEGSK